MHFYHISGAYRRVVPPSCVTTAIRRKWPAPEGENFTFFKKPKASGSVLKWYFDTGLVTEETAADNVE